MPYALFTLYRELRVSTKLAHAVWGTLRYLWSSLRRRLLTLVLFSKEVSFQEK